MNTLSAEQLQDLQDQNEDFLLINTLDREHFADTRIPGSVNIPQSQPDFVQNVEQKAGGKDDPLVVYCAGKECNSSSEAAKKLEAAGFTKVFDFEAGAEGWKQAGRNLATA